MDKYLVKRIEQILGIEIGDSSEIILGYGEWCIVILSEVLNKYLMEQNFLFNKPNFKKFKKEEINLNLNTKSLGVVEDLNSSFNKTAKGLKFNKTTILLKLDRLDNKKLDSDYEYFLERISFDNIKNKLRNNYTNKETENLKNSKDKLTIGKLSLRVKDTSFNYSLNEKIEKLFDNIYYSENKDYISNKKTEPINYNSGIETYNSNIKKNIDVLAFTLKNTIKDDLNNVEFLMNKENYLFGNSSKSNYSSTNESFISLREKLINCKAKKTESNHLLIEKKKSILNKEIKLEKINENLNSLTRKLNSIDENSPSNLKIKILDSINTMRKEIINLDLKLAVLDTVNIKSYICQLTNRADLKRFVNSKGLLLESELNGNLFDEQL
jgi:hypothetical protein